MTASRKDCFIKECLGCHKRQPVSFMRQFHSQGLFCWRCRKSLEHIASTTALEPKKPPTYGILPGEPPKASDPKPKDTVRWWDAKHREWRWVAKRSKPELKPYEKSSVG
jgi:hypothetical protein